MTIATKEEVKSLLVTKDDLLRLSQFHNSFCVSVYIPTHRAGFETLKGQDALNLKNRLKEIRTELADQGMNTRGIGNFINPLLDLVEDADFWRHQSDGLAIFLSHDLFEKFNVPLKFEEFIYISSEFYLKPLLPVFNDNGLFYLLTLKKDEVRLFEGNKYSITEVDVSELVPSRLEDTVGYDYEQKQLQFRTVGRGQGGAGSFHGHGEGEAKNKNELQLFFREIDRGIMTKLHDFQEPPLVLCCIDYYFPLFKEVTTHKNLYPGHISNNPADLDARLLHEKACELLEPYFTKSKHERKERFFIALDRRKASSELREIVPAAVLGKVDTLFIEKSSDIFGVYDPANGALSIEEEKSMSNVSLINLAAKKVFEQGGTVYVLDTEEMPDPLSGMNALFRY